MDKRVMHLQVDLYTRAILTVIAISLMGLLLRPLFAVKEAEAGTKSNIQDVNIAKINGRYLSSSSAVIKVEMVKK